jgi:nucleoside-diphosphate-sugar epimerase
MKIAVTGPTGYIGTHFVEMAQAQGHEIVFLARTPPGSEVSSWIYYNLSDLKQLRLPNDTDVILHLAYQTPSRFRSRKDNEFESMKNILSASKDINARVIFLSSQTAGGGTSNYGMMKRRLEDLVINSGNIAVRPGLVYGGHPMGLFLKLINSLRNQNYIPSFCPPPKVQPIHVQDLCICLLSIMELKNSRTKLFYLGEEHPVSFTLFMKFLAKAYINKKIVFIPIPTLPALWVSNLLRYTWPKASQIASLLTLPSMNTSESLHEINFKIRPAVSVQDLTYCSWRELLQESFIIYSYILSQRPCLFSLRSYVRLIKNNRGGVSLKLPHFFSYLPSLVCAYDQSSSTNSWVKELNWRVNSASLLIEASTQGAVKLLKIGANSFLRSGATILVVLFKELALRFLGANVRLIITSLPPRSWGKNP